MTRPGKFLTAQAGFELRTFHFRGGRLNHLANEAVSRCGGPLTAMSINAWEVRKARSSNGFMQLEMFVISSVIDR